MTHKTLFRELLGESPQVKVIDFFIDNHITNNGWSIVELMKETKAGYSTLKLLLPKLLKKRILKVERKIGKSKLYQLNKDNPVVIKLLQFDWALAKDFVDNEVK